MSTVFRAKDQPVATRLDYWLHAVDQTFGPVSVRPPADARLISRADAEQYRIDVAVRGHMGVE